MRADGVAVGSERPGSLGDPARMRRLAGAIATGMLGEPVVYEGVRRDAVDLHTAMRSEGLVHEFGRPLWSAATDAEDAIDRVARRLAANPYRQDRPIDRATVSDYVHRHYFDLRPWPFGALVDEGEAIAAAYRAQPQTAEENAWALANAMALTEAEPW